MSTRSYVAKKGQVDAKWRLVDVSDKVLGRAAVEIARILMGKHHPEYTPHVDTGDFVVVVNADKVKITGRAKLDQRLYERYSGYPSGRRTVPLRQMLVEKPDFVVYEAVRRMMPKSKLARHMLKKLKVYAGPEHPHQAQQPQKLEI